MNAEEKMCEKLKEEIPRQLFEIPIQAAIGSKIIARETVRAMRKRRACKNVTEEISAVRESFWKNRKKGKKTYAAGGQRRDPSESIYECIEAGR